jgi:purine-binding chemotaxis protein CheW
MDMRTIEKSKRDQLVTFRLGREIYGINIFEIQEVIHYQEITSIPNTPEFVEGVIQLRNQVIPVVDLKKRLGIEGEDGKKRRIVILELNERLLGIIVDNISKVHQLESANYEDLPEAVVGNRNKTCLNMLAKIDDMLIIIISPERILDGEEKQILNEFHKNSKQTLEVLENSKQEKKSAKQEKASDKTKKSNKEKKGSNKPKKKGGKHKKGK